MGQYWYAVNATKKEYLHPHRFGDGLKMYEFGASGGGTMQALAMLLAEPESMGDGGGDFPLIPELTGRWAGDDVRMVGDYGRSGAYVTAADEYEELSPLFEKWWHGFTPDSGFRGD